MAPARGLLVGVGEGVTVAVRWSAQWMASARDYRSVLAKESANGTSRRCRGRWRRLVGVGVGEGPLRIGDFDVRIAPKRSAPVAGDSSSASGNFCMTFSLVVTPSGIEPIDGKHGVCCAGSPECFRTCFLAIFRVFAGRSINRFLVASWVTAVRPIHLLSANRSDFLNSRREAREAGMDNRVEGQQGNRSQLRCSSNKALR